MSALAAQDAYRLWAPSYSDETAISYLENQLVAEMTPPLAGLRLLDAGCGVGRRLQQAGAAFAVGVDFCPEMLKAGSRHPATIQTLVGDVRRLPLQDDVFDVVWCRLVLGHLVECATAYAEFARVAADGAVVIVTDFHAAAYAAGHRRTFRSRGAVHEVEHHVHTVGQQLAAADANGLTLVDVREAAIGPEVIGFYQRAGRGGLYQAHVGLPVVLALAFRRGG